MKLTIIFLLFGLSFSNCEQTTTSNNSNLLTLKYAGTYSYGSGVENGGVGNISIYPETDSTILFYLDINRGAPSYNMGSLYGQLKIKNDNGTFYSKFDYTDNACKLAFQFSKDILNIKTVDGQDGCGFGNAVYADGDFKRETNKIPDYFENGEGTKVYFKTTSPEEYYNY